MLALVASSGGGVRAQEHVELFMSRTELVWTAPAGETLYDVVRGDLATLRQTGGQYIVSTTECAVDDWSQQTGARGINDNGDVLGVDANHFDFYPWISFDAEQGQEKVLLADLLSEEDRDEWELWLARDINDEGQIVGIGLRDGVARGFLMTPR